MVHWNGYFTYNSEGNLVKYVVIKAAMSLLNISEEVDFVVMAYKNAGLSIESQEMTDAFWDLDGHLDTQDEVINNFALDILAGRIHYQQIEELNVPITPIHVS